MKNNEGIILDDLYSYAFLGKAISDNYLPIKSNEIDESCARKIAMAKPFQQKALEMSLLYYLVFLHNIEEEELIDDLGETDLIDILDEHPDLHPDVMFPNFIVERGKYLKWFILPKIEEELKKIDNNVSFAYDYLLECLQNPVDLIKPQFDDNLSIKNKKEFAVLRSTALNLALRIKSITNLLLYNSEYQLPIITTRANFSGNFEDPGIDNSVLDQCNDKIYTTYMIYLDEISLVPKVRTIDDVIRLRDHKRIVDFREALNNWSLEIIKGDVKAEERMRNEIRKGNEELKKIGEYQKIGKWATYISLPLSVAGAYFGTNLGVTLIPISLGVRIYSDWQERNYKWLLFGR
jgi:hypothetical protein